MFHRQSGRHCRATQGDQGNFKQPEPPLAVGILFSGLVAMARAIQAPTPRLGYRPRVSLGVGNGGGGGGNWGYPELGPGTPPWVRGSIYKKKVSRTQVQIHTQRPQYTKNF